MGRWRIVITPRLGLTDPVARRAHQTISDFQVTGVQQVRSGRVFLLDLPRVGPDGKRLIEELARGLLADQAVESFSVVAEDEPFSDPTDAAPIEVFPRPGVMDSVAESTRVVLKSMGLDAASVRTGRRFELMPPPSPPALLRIRRLLGNDCIEEVITGSKPPTAAPQPPEYRFNLRTVGLRELDDAGLERLSRQGHLFLSIDEMLAIQAYYVAARREPTDLELETLAQTWSEHCVHKTLKAEISYQGAPMPNLAGRDTPREQGTGAEPPEGASSSPDSDCRRTRRRYANLLNDTIARATDEIMAEGRGPTCLSVFKDNAGIIAFDDVYGVAVKVETHNHPSAIEPYGGAATGVGGVIRDVLGCGLGAKPIANTDVFCVAPPDWPVDAMPKGVIHPKSVLKGVVAGVRDYGNCMGIPTVNGAVYFDPRYLGNPLVYCGCVGLIPRNRIEKSARPGDAIVLLGGRTGRDGIHGATFSSAELSDTHTDEFAHAVQIGNPIEEKKVLDVILQARDWPAPNSSAFSREPKATGEQPTRCLFSAITDCGAGGLSSAIGEMAAEIGAEVDLERVPLKYAGLRYDEIWISEAQERMVLAVSPENVDTFLALARGEDVEATVIGRFTDTRRLVVKYDGTIVGDLDMAFLHEGLPKRSLHAEWQPTSIADKPEPETAESSRSVADELKRRLSTPTIASKHWIIRQYDHEVQAGSVVKPLVGPGHGPSDAAVIRPRLDSDRGVVIGCGLAPQLYDIDPYWMAVAAIDEALRNVVCVGGDPSQTAILDNFCWPRVDNAQSLGALVRTCQACHDVAKAYGIPFISGKDSLNNEFALEPTDVDLLRRVLGDDAALRKGRIAIPGTLLISAISLVNDVRACVTMDLKQPGSTVALLGRPMSFTDVSGAGATSFDADTALKTHRQIFRLIRAGLLRSVHDVSDGGVLVAIAEMAIGGQHSIRITAPCEDLLESFPAMYVVEVAQGRESEFERALGSEVPWRSIGQVTVSTPLRLEMDATPDARSTSTDIPLDSIARAWRSPLDW